MQIIPKTLPEAWQKLFDLSIEEIYPNHRKPIKEEKAGGEFERWKNNLKVNRENIKCKKAGSTTSFNSF